MTWIMIYIDTIAMEVDRLISWRLLMDKGCLRPFFNYLQNILRQVVKRGFAPKNEKKKKNRSFN